MTDTFDFVVVGGGSGGCAVAGRLSEDAEHLGGAAGAGGENDNWVVTTPFALVADGAGKLNNWAFNTVPQKGLNGRIGYQPRGKGLGGSSAINAMVYIRGHAGTTTNGPRSATPAGRSPTCCPISSARKTTPISAASITARAGRCTSTSCAPTIRCSEIFLQAAQEAPVPASRGFQCRRARRPRHLSGDAEERRALERGARLYPPAYGQAAPICASRPTRTPRASCSKASARSASNTARARKLKQIRARREVIVSSGAFQTPQLLMLSGVGDAAALGKHGIASVHHCPASARICRTIPISCSATCRTIRTSTASRSRRIAAAAARDRPVPPRSAAGR